MLRLRANSEANDRHVAIESRFIDIDGRFMDIDSRFMDIDSRFMDIDSRFMDIDCRFMDIDSWFVDIDNRFVDFDSGLSMSTMNRQLNLMISNLLGNCENNVTFTMTPFKQLIVNSKWQNFYIFIFALYQKLRLRIK